MKLKKGWNVSMTNKDKIIRFTGVSCLILLLTVFILTLFGFVDLRFSENTTYVNPWLEFLINSILFYINLVFVFYYCLNSGINKAIVTCIAYIPIDIFFQLLFDNCLIISSVLPLLFLLVISFKTKTFLRYLFFSTLTIVYQEISMYIKYHRVQSLYLDDNIFSVLILSIDLILFYIFICKEVNIDVPRPHCELVVLSKGHSIPSNPKVCEEILTKRQNIIFVAISQSYQIFQLIVVIGIGIMNNALMELFIILAVFWVGRKILQRSWHSDKLWICSCATFSGFYVLTKVTPPIETSLFLVVVLSSAFVYLLHIIGVKSERLEELERHYDTDFSKYGFSRSMSEFAYDYKINKLTIKEQMAKTGLTEQVVKNYRTKVNNSLKSNKVTF